MKFAGGKFDNYCMVMPSGGGVLFRCCMNISRASGEGGFLNLSRVNGNVTQTPCMNDVRHSTVSSGL